MQRVNILWTGGLDSTFRVCELSRLGVEIQPYYIIEERVSEKYEINAIKKITSYLRNQPKTVSLIRDPFFVDWLDFPKLPDVKDAWLNLNKKYRLGSQYEYLANFARAHNIILEVGLEKSERSKAYNAIIGEGKLTINDDSDIVEYKLKTQESSDDINTIFGNFRFPKRLFEISKLEEVQLLNEMGLKDVVNMTWFCHNPVLDLPCGRCNPCKDALIEGFAWRVPFRGRVFGFLRGCKNIIVRHLVKNGKK